MSPATLREVTIRGPEQTPGDECPDALCFSEVILLIDQLAELPSPPKVVRFEGFELNTETFRLVEYARIRRLRPVMRLDAAGRSIEWLEEVASETGAVIVIPVDGSVSSHGGDAMIRAAEHAALRGITVEIETLLRPDDLSALPSLAQFIKASGFTSWTLDFLGDPRLNGGLLTSRDTARAFRLIDRLASRMRIFIEIREAPSFRRFLREQVQRNGEREGDTFRVMMSREVLLISPTGVVSPGPALPLQVGDIRRSELSTINTQSALLTALRDPRQLRGRCGSCEFRDVCGGSRARAWRMTRNVLAEDPGCFRAPARTSDAGRSLAWAQV